MSWGLVVPVRVAPGVRAAALGPALPPGWAGHCSLFQAVWLRCDTGPCQDDLASAFTLLQALLGQGEHELISPVPLPQLALKKGAIMTENI